MVRRNRQNPKRKKINNEKNVDKRQIEDVNDDDSTSLVLVNQEQLGLILKWFINMCLDDLDFYHKDSKDKQLYMYLLKQQQRSKKK